MVIWPLAALQNPCPSHYFHKFYLFEYSGTSIPRLFLDFAHLTFDQILEQVCPEADTKFICKTVPSKFNCLSWSCNFVTTLLLSERKLGILCTNEVPMSRVLNRQSASQIQPTAIQPVVFLRSTDMYLLTGLGPFWPAIEISWESLCYSLIAFNERVAFGL